MKNPAVFVDKDATLIRDVPYNVSPDLIELSPNAGRCVAILRKEGFRVVVISNQAGIALGYFPETALKEVEGRLQELLSQAGAQLDGFYYCPHHPRGKIEAYRQSCTCRKPGDEMLRRAAQEQDLDLENSWMVGDIAADILAGQKAGCRTILFTQYHNTASELQNCKPDFVAKTWQEVELIILQHSASERGERKV